MKHRPLLHLEDDDNDIVFMEYACRAALVHRPLQTMRDGQPGIAVYITQPG